MGGGMSVHEIGLVKALKEGNYNFIDRDEMEDKRAAMLFAYDADVFLMSANAMTEDGILVNIDGNANRVSALAQGPRKVIVIAGMNKICDDVDGAMKRARSGIDLNGDYTEYSKEWDVSLNGLTVHCKGDGALVNCANADMEDLHIAVLYNCGEEGRGLDEQNLMTVFTGVQASPLK